MSQAPVEQTDTKAAVTEEKGHGTPRVQQLIYIRIDIFFLYLQDFLSFGQLLPLQL